MRQARAIQWLTALGMCISAGMFALGATILIEARTDAWRQAEQGSNNLLLALSRDITRNITLYDLSIQGVRDAIARPDIAALSPEIRHMALFDRAANAEYLGALLVLDANGDITADSTAVNPHKLNFSDRDFFEFHRAQPDAGLFISRPYRSRLRGGDPSIAITRRISRPDGTFGGVVTGTLRLAYFSNLFGKLDLGSAGSVTIFRSDGRLIMREPNREADIDRDMGNTALFRRYMETGESSIKGKAILDGVERLYAFRHLPGLPLVLSVAVGVSDVYAAWWRKAFGIGAVLGLLCGMTVILSMLFRSAIMRQMEAEGRLKKAVEKLAVIATTDPLTGLANRRAFEERLEQEWLRSIRSETSITLLMLDADYFKRYNDHYGHPAGDSVLRSIAGCIADNMLRPCDLGARYGGEEFIVLLPETDFAGAAIVAERIRVFIQELGILHAEHPAGRVTVSIGVAVAYPSVGDSSAALISRADTALYDAKHAGRNCVSGLGSGAALLTRLERSDTPLGAE